MMSRRMRYRNQIDGLVVVDKPLGWTSMQVVRCVRQAAGHCKTGHAGTLDPLATGVLICCLGKATRCVPILMGMTKVYEATINLAGTTPTCDLESEVVPLAVGGLEIGDVPKRAAILQVLESFVGDVSQQPPMHSAIQINGQRAYALARAGMQVDMPMRVVRIDRIDLRHYDWPSLAIQVTCGKGTYIRSLARDIGARLGVGGYLTGLRRLSVGGYGVAGAMDEQRLMLSITQCDLLPMPVGEPGGRGA